MTDEKLPINIGVDVGKVHDPTAFCVSEVAQVPTGEIRYTSNPTLGHFDGRGNWIPPQGIDQVMRTEYTVKTIKRLPLNTSYPAVAKYLSDMLENPVFANRKVRLLMDVTGVGRPVYDSLKSKIFLRLNNAKITHDPTSGGIQFATSSSCVLQLKPISFVHGEKYNRSKGSLGKAFLVSRLQSILQEKRFHAPNIPEVVAMCEELMVYEIKIDDKGKDTYGAFKTGAHDDLATSAGLSVLEDPYSERVSYSKRVF